MTCPHRRYHDVSNLFGGVWATARRCDDCGEWVPWGEARDTDETECEVLAAEVALAYDEKLGPIVALFAAPTSDAVDPYIGSFKRGWLGGDSTGGFMDWMDDHRSYAIGALARSIWSHEEE